MVQYGRPSRSSRKESVWSSSGRTIMGKAMSESSIGTRLGKSFHCECFFVNRARGSFSSVYVGRYQIGRQDRKHRIDLEIFYGRGWLGRANIILWHHYLGCTQRDCKTSKDILNSTHLFESRTSVEGLENCLILKNPKQTFLHGPTTWKIMWRNVWKIFRICT